MNCIFCRIASGEIPSDILYQDEQVIAVRDINPRAPVHVLVVPRLHIPSMAEVKAEHELLLGHMVYIGSEMARKEGIAEKGYRVVINSGPDGRQEVPHLHLHILGGRLLKGMG